VKLDPGFVDRLVGDDAVATVVDAAHAAGLRVAALAVEREEEAERARAAGFDLAQGFWFARPGPPTDVDALLATG
jgi:EAL domain-containing protein (putative c-di-GMP-specific phosphodiesterase class I)